MLSQITGKLKGFRTGSASILDIVDNVRVDLKRLGDQRFFEATLSELPQFIVVGAQSAGKSSALRRISGVKLPESATLGTRVSAVLRIRRGDEKLKVTLQYPDGRSNDFPVSDMSAVEQGCGRRPGCSHCRLQGRVRRETYHRCLFSSSWEPQCYAR